MYVTHAEWVRGPRPVSQIYFVSVAMIRIWVNVGIKPGSDLGRRGEGAMSKERRN